MLKELLEKLNGEKANKERSNELAEINISNTEKLYNIAMDTNAKDFEAVMIKNKALFLDADKIDFDIVDWKTIFDLVTEE